MSLGANSNKLSAMKTPHWLQWTAIFLLITATLTLALITQGVFDPRPLGTNQWRETQVMVTVPATRRQLVWQETKLPLAPYSLRVTAVHQQGEQDVAYGIVVGSEVTFLAVVITPSGQVTIWQENADGTQQLLRPTAPFPHVRPPPIANEIWLDNHNNQLTLRINREWLWQGEIELQQQWGVVTQSFGSTAVIQLQTIELFTDFMAYPIPG